MRYTSTGIEASTTAGTMQIDVTSGTEQRKTEFRICTSGTRLMLHMTMGLTTYCSVLDHEAAERIADALLVALRDVKEVAQAYKDAA